MRVTTRRFAFGARAERLRLVLLVLAVFLCGWSLVGEAANVPIRSGSAGLTTWSVETLTLDSVVSATETSAQVGRDIVSRIGYGGKQLGTVAAMEVSAIGVADIAAVVARASGPVMLAMLAGDLALRGYQQCMSSGSGWCKRAPANLSESDTGFNGWGWNYGYNTTATGGNIANGVAASPGAACSAMLAADAYLAGQKAKFAGMKATGNGTSYECHYTNDGGDNFYAGTSQASGCVSGYVLSGAQCVVDTSVPASWLPASYPDIASAWNAQMASNPSRIKDYWSQMTPDQQAQAAQNGQRQPTQIKGSDTVYDPGVSSGTETTTKADGTLQQCTTNTGVRVQARSNDSATGASSPLNYQTTATTTRTCPDGTTTTTNNTDTGNSGTGSASSPTATQYKGCGLADSGPCKIDETGTPAYSEPTVAKSKMDDADSRLKSQVDGIGQAKSDQFGIADVVKPLQGACSPFSYAVPKGAGVESVDIDLCPTLDLGRDGATWVWLIVSALVSILLVRDAINGA
ncbi:hypothetical protein [Ralstonia pseudosolanacearum]|uniref:Uncharacterized protein n=1 Tax=Ralstonia solanacearum TaxID=305 RepID=A0A0S4WUV8_RALSL|nr:MULTISPECIES: hypothetical protein [Ralstonia]UZF17383.1 hypothetical protein LH706_25895 [Ralstonia solanacearum]MCK4140586.1 hypothetical protein [Ralstonia pseudosolanacearum]UQY85137.1 hypothetical protein JNO62_18070 [Ralstonia pseudosolanacearum]UZF27086.1 hypothetical protein LGV80_23545 [Ralstonia sp. RS642]UZF32138.1 hypothetical protein LGV82_23955 [Ralstonia sp. RS650]